MQSQPDSVWPQTPTQAQWMLCVCVCVYCGRRFYSKAHLLRHDLVHKACEYCRKTSPHHPWRVWEFPTPQEVTFHTFPAFETTRCEGWGGGGGGWWVGWWVFGWLGGGGGFPWAKITIERSRGIPQFWHSIHGGTGISHNLKIAP